MRKHGRKLSKSLRLLIICFSIATSVVGIVETWMHIHDDGGILKGYFVTPYFVVSLFSSGKQIIVKDIPAMPLPDRVNAISSSSAIGLGFLITVNDWNNWLIRMGNAGFVHLEDLGSMHIWSHQMGATASVLIYKTRGGIWYFSVSEMIGM